MTDYRMPDEREHVPNETVPSGPLLLPPAAGSATCSICKWTNVSLLNLGEHGSPRWACHGCCKRMLDALERIVRYPVHSEPVGGAMAMQDFAHDALSPNEQGQRPR